MSQQTVPDLSPEGVDRILAALANAGIEVHYNETDGDTAIDIWLTELDTSPARILSWRDVEGWRLGEWDETGGLDEPDRKWPITPADLTGLAVEVARLVDADEAPDHDPEDYWVQLAVALHSAADKVLTLAGSGLAAPRNVRLSILGSVLNSDAERMIPTVDALAAAFGSTASISGKDSWLYLAEVEGDPLKVGVRTYVPEPADPREAELERLRNELAATRAELDAKLATATAGQVEEPAAPGRVCRNCGATSGLIMRFGDTSWDCVDAAGCVARIAARQGGESR